MAHTVTPTASAEDGRSDGSSLAGPVLRLVGITKSFDELVANRDISVDLHAGEIRGLLGENGAGKSTLMNILYGLLRPDEGRIEVDGNPVDIRSPRDAAALGIGMVHQHFMLVPDMTVAENVALGLPSDRRPLSNVAAVGRRIRELSAQYHLDIDPESVVQDLGVGMQQRVEIVKILCRDARILVFDEPTAVLSPLEWTELAAILRSLAREGRSIVFITHKLDEMLGVADSCTVLRDGAVVGEASIATTNKADLARMMVGRDVVLRITKPPRQRGAVRLDVTGLSLEGSDSRPLLSDINFMVHAGEIFGIAGVDGNGQRELAEVLLGVTPATAGDVSIDGEALRPPDPRKFRELGGAIIPEDRHRTGVMLDCSVGDNLIIKDCDDEGLSRHGLLAPHLIQQHCQRLLTEYDVRARSASVPLRQLSGGNQQKVVLARELSRAPAVLIAAQPTRGLDVGAMEFVYERILEQRRQGAATVLISSDLDELLSLSDRLGVIVRGHISRIVDALEISVEEIGLLMAGEQV